MVHERQAAEEPLETPGAGGGRARRGAEGEFERQARGERGRAISEVSKLTQVVTRGALQGGGGGCELAGRARWRIVLRGGVRSAGAGGVRWWVWWFGSNPSLPGPMSVAGADIAANKAA